MNLKLKRLVRTPTSEQYALFDLDQLDGAYVPTTIGKLDLHFTGEGMYGTLLLWDEGIRGMKAGARRAFVRTLLADLAQPMGVPNEYVVEFFAPTLDHYEVIHNVGLGQEDAEDDLEDDDLQAEALEAEDRSLASPEDDEDADGDGDDDLDEGLDEDDEPVVMDRVARRAGALEGAGDDDAGYGGAGYGGADYGGAGYGGADDMSDHDAGAEESGAEETGPEETGS